MARGTSLYFKGGYEMKNFKKVLSLVLAILMVVGCVVVAPINTKAETTYTRVTELSALTAGTKFVIVAEYNSKYYVAGEKESGGKGYSPKVVTLDNLSGGTTFEIVSVTGGKYIIKGGSDYIKAAEKKFTFSTSSSGCEWEITCADGKFQFSNATGTKYYINLNQGQYLRCYADKSSNSQYVQKWMVYTLGENTTPGGGNTGDGGNTGNQTPTYANDAAIVEAVYKLADGSQLDDGAKYDLTGTVIAVNTSYASNKISVTIEVPGAEGKPIQCYNLVAGAVSDVSKVDVGDTIKANGALKNYKGTYEFNGCTLESYTAGSGAKTYASEEALLADVVALKAGYGIAGKQTLTGIVKSVDTAYAANYGNITVTIKIGDVEVQCYRLKDGNATAAANLAVDDKITVTGNIMRYSDTKVEFVAGCTIDAYTAAADLGGNAGDGGAAEDGKEDKDNTTKEILDAAFALADGEYLVNKETKHTLTGVVKSFDKAGEAGEACVTITVEGKDIYCYWLKGEGAENLKAGDKITVTGPIKNYGGLIEFEKASFVMAEETPQIPNKGDSFLPMFAILFAGAALVTVAVVGKKRMA